LELKRLSGNFSSVNWMRKCLAVMLAGSFFILALQHLELQGARHRASLLEQETAVEKKRFDELRHRFQRVRKHFEPAVPVPPDKPMPALNRAA
jgi:hypothetical protein